jgi:hypothetical protein
LITILDPSLISERYQTEKEKNLRKMPIIYTIWEIQKETCNRWNGEGQRA